MSAPTFWINQASRMIMRRFEERLRPLGFGVAYLPVAVTLDEHGALQQKELLDHVAIEQPTMTALLARMERDRLVVRKPDPDDARARRVSLTAHGKRVLEDVKATLPHVVDDALVGVTTEDQATLLRILRRIVENLGEPGAEGDGRPPGASPGGLPEPSLTKPSLTKRSRPAR